ncbi:PREDICTED: uncharacterized protein LOC104806357 [Tarenaya hassleriana]|uniref:uncharacterized protein LOC104806357 n=1 Tax=Tarenaya hassleriana TaxID=28532 RepID=UPI00053C2E3C|nr:PREDICTED: uncharacterized protein LOC104806357 [Tarenaya hassleriana]
MGGSFFITCTPLFIVVAVVALILLQSPNRAESQTIQSAHLLDLLIRDYTFRKFDIHLKTGTTQKINLPLNFSGISIETGRFRCGSLRRYGARIGEFHMGPGTMVQPCAERVMVVRQNLGSNWSSVYTTGFNLTGYGFELASSVLGLLAYNANPDGVANNPYEVNILGTDQNPILIDFWNSNASRNPKTTNFSIACASFTRNGKATFRQQVSPYVCTGTTQGHYALVTKAPRPEEKGPENGGGGGGVVDSPEAARGGGSGLSRWKVAVGSVVGSGIGAFLLGLLVVAMVVKVKKKAMREEMERRAYEEEALQVSMVGHVRAPTASGTRTVPRIDGRYCVNNLHPS